MMSMLQDSIDQRGPFHEDEIVGLQHSHDGLRLTVLRKTCGDREEDRVVEQRIELVFREVRRVALSIQGEAVAARKLLESTMIDLSIVHLEASSDDRRLTIDFDGFIDGVSCDSARLVVDAGSIELLYANG